MANPVRIPPKPVARMESDCPDGPRVPDRLVERFMPLARRVAARYHQSRREPLDDLVQVASLALVKAARRYDGSRGVSFGAYAMSTIEGELKNHLRDHTWAVHVPRSAKERALRVHRAVLACERQGIAPTTSRLTERLGMTEQEVLEARQAWQASEAGSLDGPIREDQSDRSSLPETMGFPDERYELVEQRYMLEAACRVLRVRDRRILHMRFFEDRTQAEIAANIGVSQMHVSRMLKGALARLEVAIEGRTGL
jgi:RNA polymerase sigma-B factor